MIYYTADLHFGHCDIIRKTGRPFQSVAEMDEALIRNWNSVVSEEDTVYLVGDIACHDAPFPREYLSRLKGKKHLIRGNHDTAITDAQELFDYFESVSDYLEIDDGNAHVLLCHYPVLYTQSSFVVHGHIHNAKHEIYQTLRRFPLILNAGIDINHFHPVTLEELIDNNQEHYADASRGLQKRLLDPGEPSKRRWKPDFRPLPVKGEHI